MVCEKKVVMNVTAFFISGHARKVAGVRLSVYRHVLKSYIVKNMFISTMHKKI